MQAECIVTRNLKDFPNSVVQRYGITAVSPDEIVFRLIQEVPDFVLQVVKKHRLGLSRPPFSVEGYFSMLEKQGLLKTVTFLKRHEIDI